uniref:Tyrosine-protein phosphatase domain-containing protein n=1 Tax=Strongyloides stercoralis TaxID=6248 RepID=A0A0K0E9Q8_STRER
MILYHHTVIRVLIFFIQINSILLLYGKDSKYIEEMDKLKLFINIPIMINIHHPFILTNCKKQFEERILNNKNFNDNIKGSYNYSTIQETITEQAITFINDIDLKLIKFCKLFEKKNVTLDYNDWSIFLTSTQLPMSYDENGTYDAQQRQKPIISSCSNESLIYIIKSKNYFLKIFNYTKDQLYNGDIIYGFYKTDFFYKNKFVKPCGALKAIHNFPEINIKNNKGILININETKLKLIKMIGSMNEYQFMYTFKNNTVNPNFYTNTSIYVYEEKFTENNNFTFLKEKKIYNNNKIFIDNFQIINVKIKCINCMKNKNIIEQKFFFAPQNNSTVTNLLTFYDPKILYRIKPNCSIDEISFGYLESITFDNKILYVNEFNNGTFIEEFSKKGKFIVYDRNTVVTLNCTYKIPTGYYYLIKQYSDPINLKNEIKHIERNELEDNIETNKNIIKNLLRNKAIIGVVILFFVILCIICSIFYSCNKKRIRKYLKVRKLRKFYPNIYCFWDSIKHVNIKNYVEGLKDKKYVPNVASKINFKIIVSGCDMFKISDGEQYNKSLVLSQKNEVNKFYSHYIDSVYTDRKYIISDGPRRETFLQFWKMIISEQISTILFISSPIYSVNDELFKLYLNLECESFDGLIINIQEKYMIEHLTTTVIVLNLKMNEYQNYSVTIFIVDDWKINEIPESSTNLIDLYEEICNVANEFPILIHEINMPGSRTFTFIYFASIIERFINDKTIADPMIIIRIIKEQRSGGSLSLMECAFLLNSIIEYFLSKEILLQDEIMNSFFSNYNDYINSLYSKIQNIDMEKSNFLNYINNLDLERIRGFDDLIQRTYILPDNILKLICTQFYTTLEEEKLNNLEGYKKIRYENVPSLNEYILYNSFGELTLNNINQNYLNLNHFFYQIKDKKYRKLIMSQAPLLGSFINFYKMIYDQKVSIIISLVNIEEYNSGKWDIYFPSDQNEFVVGDFVIIKNSERLMISYGVYSINYILKLQNNSPETDVYFTLLHYEGCPIDGLAFTPEGYISVYNTILSLRYDRPILIHDTAGVSRTGIMSLIIYMIDNIDANRPFDPSIDLLILRQHRYGSVVTVGQFVMALQATCFYFKNLIDKLDNEKYQETNDILSQEINFWRDRNSEVYNINYISTNK